MHKQQHSERNAALLIESDSMIMQLLKRYLVADCCFTCIKKTFIHFCISLWGGTGKESGNKNTFITTNVYVHFYFNNIPTYMMPAHLLSRDVGVIILYCISCEPLKMSATLNCIETKVKDILRKKSYFYELFCCCFVIISRVCVCVILFKDVTYYINVEHNKYINKIWNMYL